MPSIILGAQDVNLGRHHPGFNRNCNLARVKTYIHTKITNSYLDAR